MLDDESTDTPTLTEDSSDQAPSTTASDEAPKKATRRRATKAAAAPTTDEAPVAEKPKKAPAKKAPAKKAAAKKAPAKKATAQPPAEDGTPEEELADETLAATEEAGSPARAARAPMVVTFQAPEAVVAPPRARRRAGTDGAVKPADLLPEAEIEEDVEETEDATEEGTGAPRRRRRGRRGRGGARPAEGTDETEDSEDEESEEEAEGEDGAAGTTRRRRRRRRAGTGADGEDSEDDVPTVVHVREPRQRQPRAPRDRDGGNAADEDGVRGISGSTRMAAKRVRRQEGRDSGRKRVPILTEAEFLARREAVDRQMVVRQKGDRTQIAVLEDGILVEHYVTKQSATSYAGNVYLGRVQNVLPSMEAAFVDIGKGRNAVLYAGEVNWEGVSGGSRKIEQVLKSGQEVLVQVSKDPIGHKGARLTSQISLPGRYLVYVPESSMTGISRKLPENERTRLKNILKNVVPEGAGVIIRTAAEGVAEEEIAKDVRRLQAQWEVIQTKAKQGGAPKALHTEPDLVIKVVRDIFNEDFNGLVVQGESEWETIRDYVEFVAPDLAPRLKKYAGNGDVFAEHRIDEQLLKALDRKVYLPSGGSLVIDRTEAMVVIDVNTGKYVGKGGNLEETVTRNNLEAAEEIARQLRLRDVGGIIVVDFIDMVLESNRDLVVRRLVECLGRDRTKHQVAEVTSLGLVQMTRKRVGQGLLESFSETCEACNGRGVKVFTDPVEPKHRHEDHRDRAPKVGPKAPLPAGADAPADSAAGAGSGGGRKRRRGGRGSGSAGDSAGQEPIVSIEDVPEADAAEQATEVVKRPSARQPDISVEVPEADAAEQAVPVDLEPDALPVIADEPPTDEEDLPVLDAPVTPDGAPEPESAAAEPVEVVPDPPVKKRRRAAVRPAGSPTA
ncbi:MAG: putative ribonuclease [Frankiales bacterium]|nr:putative ribonuclease [Frankiales bacterium]